MEELNALNAAVDQSKSVIERIDKSISGLEEKYYARFAKIRAGFDAGYAEVEERRGDVMYFNSFKDIGACHIPRDEFTSKLTFSLSADDSIGLLSSRRASALPEGVCLYTNGIDSFTFRPHDYSQYE